MLEHWNIKVNQETDIPATKPEICENLGFVNRQQLFNCFDLHDHCI